MSEHLHTFVLIVLKHFVQSARYISISTNKVIAIDTTFWINVHIYTIES